VKFAVNDKAVVIYTDNLNELNDIAMCLRGKEAYLGDTTEILRIKKLADVVATIRIEGDWEILKSRAKCPAYPKGGDGDVFR